MEEAWQRMGKEEKQARCTLRQAEFMDISSLPFLSNPQVSLSGFWSLFSGGFSEGKQHVHLHAQTQVHQYLVLSHALTGSRESSY